MADPQHLHQAMLPADMGPGVSPPHGYLWLQSGFWTLAILVGVN